MFFYIFLFFFGRNVSFRNRSRSSSGMVKLGWIVDNWFVLYQKNLFLHIGTVFGSQMTGIQTDGCNNVAVAVFGRNSTLCKVFFPYGGTACVRVTDPCFCQQSGFGTYSSCDNRIRYYKFFICQLLFFVDSFHYITPDIVLGRVFNFEVIVKAHPDGAGVVWSICTEPTVNAVGGGTGFTCDWHFIFQEVWLCCGTKAPDNGVLHSAGEQICGGGLHNLTGCGLFFKNYVSAVV